MKHLIQEVIAALKRQHELGLSGLSGDFGALDRSWFFEGSSQASKLISSDTDQPTQGGDGPNSVAELKAALDAKITGKRINPRVSVPTSSTPLPARSTHADNPLQLFRAEILDCTGCALSRSRSQVVFGEGQSNAELLFVGDGPGRDEDRQGEPFLGEVGQLLDKMLSAMGLLRHQVYLTTLTKCRPPRSRRADVQEMKACMGHFERQLDLIRPKVVVAMGQTVSQVLLDRAEPITELRGQFHRRGDVKVMPTYHPAYLLKVPKAKRVVWEDLQQVMVELGLKEQSGA